MIELLNPAEHERAVAVCRRWRVEPLDGTPAFECVIEPAIGYADAAALYPCSTMTALPEPVPTSPTAAQAAELRSLVSEVLGDHPDAPDAILTGERDILAALTSWRVLAADARQRRTLRRAA